MALKIKQAAGIIILTLALLSCNLPFITPETQPIPTEIVPPTPEDTATSIYPPTFAPPAVVITATSLPPADTSTPTATSTSTLELPTNTPTKTLIPYNPNASPTPPPTIPSGYYSATPGIIKTATPSGPAPTARPAFKVTAILFTPTIDGDWSEWTNAEVPSGYVVFGGGNWINANDLNSSFKAAYDSNYLYIAAKVVDDVYAQNSTGYKIYLGDSLEILLDTNLTGDYYNRGLTSDDYQLGISAGKGSITGPKEAYLWYPTNLRGARTNVVIASQSLSDGYRVEAAIPWSIFGVTPASGTHFGFAFSVSDNDNTTQNLQESMVSSVSGRRFLNPTTWGDLLLQ
jgi:hypothetical protein